MCAVTRWALVFEDAVGSPAFLVFLVVVLAVALPDVASGAFPGASLPPKFLASALVIV